MTPPYNSLGRALSPVEVDPNTAQPEDDKKKKIDLNSWLITYGRSAFRSQKIGTIAVNHRLTIGEF